MESLQTPMLFGDDALRVFGIAMNYKTRTVTAEGYPVDSYSKVPNGWTLVRNDPSESEMLMKFVVYQ